MSDKYLGDMHDGDAGVKSLNDVSFVYLPSVQNLDCQHEGVIDGRSIPVETGVTSRIRALSGPNPRPHHTIEASIHKRWKLHCLGSPQRRPGAVQLLLTIAPAPFQLSSSRMPRSDSSQGSDKIIEPLLRAALLHVLQSTSGEGL